MTAVHRYVRSDCPQIEDLLHKPIVKPAGAVIGIALGSFEIKLFFSEMSKLYSESCYRVIALDPNPAATDENVIPAIWTGLYRAGRAGEIIFYVPGKTSACYRCICSSRYKAFAAGGANVSSVGGTIHDLHIVEAIAGQIGVGILTRGADSG